MSHSHASIPQTVESLQEIMERDAITIEILDRKCKRLEKDNKSLRTKILHLRLKK